MESLLRDSSLVDLVALLERRELSARELMEAVLRRIDEANPDLNAIVALRDRDELMAEAAAADERLARGDGRPLEGIPFAVKDLEDVAGLPTTYGSLVFRDNIAREDSVQVARLKAAGAIVVGKTNTPEFGYTAITKNLLFGVTRSPWNLERSPGGSSGGSAAALAGCLVPLVTASDGGGSIRLPASMVGAFGLKPSFGRVPIGPNEHWQYADTACYGPLTKTVEDAALFLDVVVGPSPYDPNSLPHPGYSYLDCVHRKLDGPLRIALSLDFGYTPVQEDIAEVVSDAARVFERLGHIVEPLEGGPPMLGPAWALLGNYMQLSRLAPLLPEREPEFGRSFIAAVKAARELTPERWGELAALREQLNRWCADLFAHYDLLVSPTVPFDPPPAKGPFPDAIDGRPLPPVAVAAFTIPFNLSWHPAATVRAGLSRAGLPVGMQIVGPRHADDLVLQAARAYEQERPWHPEWPVRWEPLPTPAGSSR
ncbi:Acylamidase [bacterium HR29]|jgi:Asp-tRNA(Asn)/Glu-tRNA(Gln) amidotransferase A subunit family amidase|nr:Acylamidase [bacterium HR29]